MLLPSKIELWALGDVLGGLLRAGVSGTLSLIEAAGPRAGIAHHVQLVGGSPAAVLSDGPRLGEVLTRSGAVPVGAIAAAVKKQDAGDGRLMGEVLSELVVAPERTIVEGMREQTASRVDRLFSLGAARLQFRAAPIGDRALAALARAARSAMPLEPREFLHGRPRARTGAPSGPATREADAMLLGLNVRASREEIRHAFRRLVAKHHPDRATDDTDRARRNEVVARLVAAYSRLTAKG